MKKITVILPCYNEAANIGRTYHALCDMSKMCAEVPDGSVIDMADYEWEYLFIDDGSSDDTASELEKLRTSDPEHVSVILFSRNFGKEAALLAGMDYAGGDAVVIMDADLQHPPVVVPEMVYWWRKGYDDVYGKRLDRGKEPVWRRVITSSFYSMLGKLADIDMLPNVGDFRLLDRRAVKALVSMRETQRYTKGLYSWIGYRKKPVEFYPADRTAGKSSFGLRALINLAIDGLTGFSTKPLRISALVGAIVSLLAFAYLIFIIIKTLAYGEPVQGFPTLICVILILGGFQLIVLGIIGEYIGRIFNEVKGRPPYIIRSYNGKD